MLDPGACAFVQAADAKPQHLSSEGNRVRVGAAIECAGLALRVQQSGTGPRLVVGFDGECQRREAKSSPKYSRSPFHRLTEEVSPLMQEFPAKFTCSILDRRCLSTGYTCDSCRRTETKDVHELSAPYLSQPLRACRD